MGDALSRLTPEEKPALDLVVLDTDSTKRFPSLYYVDGAASGPSFDYMDFTEQDLTSALQIENELDTSADGDLDSTQPAIALEQRKDPLLLQVIIWLTQKHALE